MSTPTERNAFYSREREQWSDCGYGGRSSVTAQRRRSVPVTSTRECGGLRDEACRPKPWKQTASADGVHLYEFQNKLRCVFVPMPANNVVSFSIVYLVGSNAETSSQYGSVHVLEHLMFKGARKYHKGSKRGDIWHALGDNGAVGVNASTSKRRTEYHSQMPVRLLESAIELEADRMESPLLDQKAAEGERIVVLNEYQRQRNSRTSLLRQKTFMASFDNGSTGKAVIGTGKTICRIISHMPELRRFQQTYYVPANACLVITGGPFDAERTLAHIHHCFGHMSPGTCSRDADGAGSLEEDQPQHGAKAVDISGPMPVGLLGFRTGMVANSREAVCLELFAEWMNMGVAGPFGDLLKNQDLHQVQADYQRCFGATLFNVWVIVTSTGNTVAKLETWLVAVLERLTSMSTSYFGVFKILDDLKTSMHKMWERETDTCEGMNAAIVESLSRCNSPFDVATRHQVLTSLRLEDLARTAHSIFVSHRMTVGKILPELEKLPCIHPATSQYSVRGGAPTLCASSKARRFPFEAAVVTPSGVYVKDETAPNVSIRIHIPTPLTSDAEAELKAALATAGVTLSDGEVLAEKDLHEAFHSSGASASVDGTHSGINLSLEMPAGTKNFLRLVSILKAGFVNPTISDADFTNKKQFLSEQIVGNDFDVNETARRVYSQSLFHDSADPRRVKLGSEEGAEIRRLTRQQALCGLREAGSMGAYVTAVAPTDEHLRAVKAAFEDGKPQAACEPAFKPPTTSPVAGRVVYTPLAGKTSATMMYGCALAVGPKHRLSLPLSLAVSVLGGSFSSRLMQIVRDRNSLTYGVNASTRLLDPECTTLSVVGTFGEDLVQRGVQCTKDVVADWKLTGITEEELDAAKKRALGSVDFTWNSPSRCADALHACRVHFRQPHERMLSLPDRIKRVTLEECNEAVTELLPPLEHWCCVVAGATPPHAVNIHCKYTSSDIRKH